MRTLLFAVFGLLGLAGPAVGQQDPPRVREPLTTEEIGDFRVMTMFYPGSKPACSIIGPMQAAFRLNLSMDSEGTANINLINTAWNLNRNSRSSVTLKTAGRTMTRAFAVQSGSSATTVLHTFIPKDDPDHDNSVSLALAAFTPGSSTDIVFADGQAYKLGAPPQEAYAAFQRCLTLINRKLEFPPASR